MAATVSDKSDRIRSPKFASLNTEDEDISSLNLSIGSHLPKIGQMVTDNFKVLVISPTGTGKSIGIPWYLGRMGYRILVSVPTITAARMLMNAQRDRNPEIKVGYAGGSVVKYDANTQIVYATSGQVRNIVMDPSRETLESFDILMLDEVHVGSLNNTLIYELMLYDKRNDSMYVPQLVLTSATVSDVLYTDVLRYTIDHVQKYRIGEMWHSRNYRPTDGALLKDTVDVVSEFHQSNQVHGDFLVFVAGKNDTLMMKELLENKIGRSANIMTAHSGTPVRELREMYEAEVDRTTGEILDQRRRKIVIATNLAETSITIPGIDWVFDTLVEKITETSPAGGIKIQQQNISKSSAIQRCGRVGRIQPGYCYRMCQPDFYLKLPDDRVDEIYRLPIHHPILELLNAGYRVEDIRSTPVHRGILDIVSPGVINSSLQLLTHLNLINDGMITEDGKLAYQLPLSIRNSATLLKWLRVYPAYPGIVAITMIDSCDSSYFSIVRQNSSMTDARYKTVVTKQRKQFEKYRGFSDVDTMLNMWIEFIMTNGFDPSDYETARWCRRENIYTRDWIQMKRRMNAVSKIVEQLGFPIDKGRFTVDNVSGALKGLFSETYDDLIMTRVITSQPTYQLSSGDRYYLNQRQSVNNFSSKYPSHIIPLVAAEFGRRKLVNVALDLPNISEDEIMSDEQEPIDEE